MQGLLSLGPSIPAKPVTGCIGSRSHAGDEMVADTAGAATQCAEGPWMRAFRGRRSLSQIRCSAHVYNSNFIEASPRIQ